MNESLPVEAHRSWTRLASLACGLGLLIVAAEARALVSTQVGIGGCTSSYSCSDPTLTLGGGLSGGEPADTYDKFPLEITDSKTDPLHGSTITATAIASYTALRAYAFASVPNGLYCPIATHCFPDIAHASATAQYSDEWFLPPTAAFPLGTVVQLGFSIHLSGIITPSFPNYAQNDARLTLCVGTFGNCDLTLVGQSAIPATTAQTATLKATVGSTLYVNAVLTVEATAETDFAPPAFTVNYLNTAVMHADALTPGFSFVTASGHDYSTPAPEPSVLLLLGVGMAGAAWRSRSSV